MLSIKYAWLAAAALTIAGTAPVSAAVAPIDNYELRQSYDVVTLFDLHHGISYNTYENGAGVTNSYNLAAPGGTIYDGFPKSRFNPPLLTYLLFTSNLADELDTDYSGPDGHLVIGLNDTFAGSLLLGQQDFTETFAGYDESSLIAALTLLDTADLDPSDDGYADQRAAKEQASSLIFDFSAEVGTLGGLTQADGGTMTLVSFSTPGTAGTATANLTRVPIPAAAPEPTTWALMLVGFGAIGFALRGQRRTGVSFG